MHEYMRRLNKAISDAIIDKGSVAQAIVEHDNYCGIYKGAECNCDPDITIHTDKGDVSVLQDGTVISKHGA